MAEHPTISSMVLSISAHNAINAIHWCAVDVLAELGVTLSMCPGIFPDGTICVADFCRTNVYNGTVLLMQLQEISVFGPTSVREGIWKW